MNYVILQKFSLTEAEQRELEGKVQQAISNGAFATTVGAPQGRQLRLDALISRIQESELNQLWIERNVIIETLKSEPPRGIALLKSHLNQLLERFLQDYPTIIEANFPMLAHASEYCFRVPKFIILAIDQNQVARSIQRNFFDFGTTLIFCEEVVSGQIPGHPVIICSTEELTENFPLIEVKGTTFRAFRSSGFGTFKYLFSSEHDSGWIAPDRVVLPLHDLIYDELGREVSNALDILRPRYGVPQRGSETWRR